jgi:hypothetical protein
LLLADPEGIHPTDDRGAEIPAVEGVLGPPVHQENFAAADALAALPNWQRSATTVAIERLAEIGAIESS